MKPYELYNLWALFDKATSDPSFSAEQKYSVGMDMLSDLPPEMLCSSSKPSLSVVRESMVSRLNEINNERRKPETGLRAGTSSVACGPKPDPEADEGDGVLLASVATSKEPTTKARKGKASQ